MKKQLTTLIKLNRQQLDALKREAVQLENQKARYLKGIENIRAERAREMEIATKAPELSHLYGNFAAAIQAREDQLKNAVKDVDKKMDALQEKLREAFQEVKKYEIALERLLEQEKEAALRRENILMDEVAIQQHMRKEE